MVSLQKSMVVYEKRHLGASEVVQSWGVMPCRLGSVVNWLHGTGFSRTVPGAPGSSFTYPFLSFVEIINFL